MIYRCLTILILACVSESGLAQGASVRVEVLAGGNLGFVFNSIAKYKTGITTPADFTVIGITADEGGGTPDYLRWELFAEIEDADGDGFITGTNPINQLPFYTVELSTSTVLGCASCQHLYPAAPGLALSGIPQVFVDGDAGGGADDLPPNLAFTTDKIGITYYVGTNPCPCPPGNNLLGSPADFYSDVILVTITMYDF